MIASIPQSFSHDLSHAASISRAEGFTQVWQSRCVIDRVSNDCAAESHGHGLQRRGQLRSTMAGC